MKIITLDDHSLFNEGLGKILSDHFLDLNLHKFTNIAGLRGNNLDFNSYDLLISDIELPEEDIFEFFGFLKLNYSKIPVLVISMHNKLSVIKKCKELNIEGYIMKDDHELFIPAVEKLLAGKEFYSDKVLETLAILNKKEKLLTPKEEEIIALLADGKSNHEISEDLFITYNTVKTHRKNISNKLELTSTVEIIKYYFENYL